MQFPTVPDEWVPLLGSSQFLNVGASTALTIPTTAQGQVQKGAVYVAILTAQIVKQWLRYDGQAVTASANGGEGLNPGDYVVVYGINALRAIRVIRDVDGGSLAVKYFYFRRVSE